MTTEVTAPPAAQQPRAAVSIRAILLSWSFADDSPFAPDDIDRIIDVAIRQTVRRTT